MFRRYSNGLLMPNKPRIRLRLTYYIVWSATGSLQLSSSSSVRHVHLCPKTIEERRVMLAGMQHCDVIITYVLPWCMKRGSVQRENTESDWKNGIVIQHGGFCLLWGTLDTRRFTFAASSMFYILLHVIFCMVYNCKSIHENSTFSLFYNTFTDCNPLFAAVIILNNYILSSPSPATANHTQNLNIPLFIIRHPSNCNPTWPLNNWPRLCLYSRTKLILTLNTLWSCEQ